jgi:hypothetical protein
MNLLGCIENVTSSDPNFEKMVETQKICRHGRFKDAKAFRDYYFNVGFIKKI